EKGTKKFINRLHGFFTDLFIPFAGRIIDIISFLMYQSNNNEEIKIWIKIYVYNIILDGTIGKTKILSSKIVIGAWGIFSIIIVSAYTGNLTFVLTTIGRMKKFNSLLDLTDKSLIDYELLMIGTNQSGRILSHVVRQFVYLFFF